jgi:hypothetical protein
MLCPVVFLGGGWGKSGTGAVFHGYRKSLPSPISPPIFAAARAANATVMTKDADFAKMVERLGPLPRVI